MNQISNFTFFENYKEVIEQLESEDKKKIFLYSIYLFIYFNIEPNFDDKSLEKVGWLGIRSSLETSINRGQNAKKENEFKTKSNKNQIKIKKKSNKNQTPSTSTSYSISKENNKGVVGEKEETLKKIQNEFNLIGLSKVVALSKSRKEKIICRLKEFGEDLIIDSIKKIPKSDFLMGKNKEGWKCSFDWLFENDKNILKVYEGNYDNKKALPEWLDKEISESPVDEKHDEEFKKFIEEFRKEK